MPSSNSPVVVPSSSASADRTARNAVHAHTVLVTAMASVTRAAADVSAAFRVVLFARRHSEYSPRPRASAHDAVAMGTSTRMLVSLDVVRATSSAMGAARYP